MDSIFGEILRFFVSTVPDAREPGKMGYMAEPKKPSSQRIRRRSRSAEPHAPARGRDAAAQKEFERRILEAAEREQRRIGEELHDNVGQMLTSLGLMADALSQRLNRSLSPRERELAAKIAEGLGRVHQDLRSLSHGLLPVGMDVEGLRVALARLAVQSSQRDSTECSFESMGAIQLDDPASGLHLYRIAQEAVSNAIRHGKARRVRIILGAGSAALTLSVEDDGTGIRQEEGRDEGMGIRLMNYRARLIGAALTIAPAPGGGTAVTCMLERQRRTRE